MVKSRKNTYRFTKEHSSKELKMSNIKITVSIDGKATTFVAEKKNKLTPARARKAVKAVKKAKKRVRKAGPVFSYSNDQGKERIECFTSQFGNRYFSAWDQIVKWDDEVGAFTVKMYDEPTTYIDMKYWVRLSDIRSGVDLDGTIALLQAFKWVKDGK